MPSAKEQIADHLANRRVRPLTGCSPVSQARSAYAAYASTPTLPNERGVNIVLTWAFTSRTCVTSAVSLWCRQVVCERALDPARRARACVTGHVAEGCR